MAKAWILMRFEEGRSAYGPYPELFCPVAVFLDKTKAQAEERRRNALLGHPVEQEGWSPFDVEDGPVFMLDEAPLCGTNDEQGSQVELLD